MIRRLILMRHAKSSWNSDAASDHERPLNKRGRRDAPAMGSALAARGWVPDLIVLSTSVRTQQTLAGLYAGFGQRVAAVADEGLYHGGLQDMRLSAVGWDPDAQTVMVLGHNPGMEYALGSLTGVHQRFTTANAALLEAGGPTDDWATTFDAGWRLEALLRPKEI